MNNVTKVTVTFTMQEAHDQDADASDLMDTAWKYDGCTAEETATYIAQDKERLKAYRNDEWHYIGIRAVATIWIERPGYRTNYTLESPGLWGIESDSGNAQLDSVYADECATLRADIEAMKLAEFKS